MTAVRAEMPSPVVDGVEPGRQRRRTLPALVICLVLYLAANAFSGDLGALGLPVGPDRMLLAVFIVLLLIDRRIDWHRYPLKSAAWVGVATVLWAAGSAFYHGTLATSLGGFALLDRLAIPYFLFAVGPAVLNSRASRILLLEFLCVLGLYLGFTAIFEIIGPHALVFPRFIIDPNVGISFGRARGPFLASDGDADAMATCLFGSCALWTVTTTRLWRALAVVSVLVCLVGVFLALTRSEWIGTGAALIVTGIMVPSVRRRLPLVLAGVAVAVVAVIALSPGVRADVTSRATDVRSVYDRQNTDAGGLRALQTDPLFGIGWEEFLAHSAQYVRQAPDYPITNIDIEIHNVALGRIVDLGIIGGGLWIMSVLLGPWAAMFAARRPDRLDEAYRIAFVGICIVWLVAIQFSPFPYPLPNSLVWLFAGLVLTPLGGDSTRGQLFRRTDRG